MIPLFGNAVQNYYLELVRQNYEARKVRLKSLKTRDDALRYRDDVLAKIQKLFPFPAEKTPLNAKETAAPADFGTFVMHRIVYESRPGFPVTGNLYLPKTSQKVPGVLFLCGHAETGKASQVYMTGARALAMKGFAVLIIDPVGQGERHQFKTVPEFDYENCCHEHNIMHKQMFLAGESLGAWRAWDAIRGLDYLLSRPEVDSSRVGVTGNSGGGTMTAFVNALDERLMMAASSCYITTWMRNIENELPADAEQMPLGTFAAGLEMGDFLIARAPRPVLILGQKNDIFDPRGTVETFEEVRGFYRLLGAEENVRHLIGPTNHGYSIENREAMYSFFTEKAQMKSDGIEPENIPLSPPDEVACLPQGMIENCPGNRYIRDIIREKALRLAQSRQPHSKEELRGLVRGILRLDEIFVPQYRVLRCRANSDIEAPETNYYSRFALETEMPRQVMAVLKVKCKEPFLHIPAAENMMLYIPHLDSQDELEAMPFAADGTVWGLDVRGVGECTPSSCDQEGFNRKFFSEYSFDYHYHSLGTMFDRPYLGGKVKDILCAVELLSQKTEKINLAANGQGTIPALLAALLSDKITTLKLIDAPESWEAVTAVPIPEKWSFANLLLGILGVTDLPEIRQMVAEKIVE